MGLMRNVHIHSIVVMTYLSYRPQVSNVIRRILPVPLHKDKKNSLNKCRTPGVTTVDEVLCSPLVCSAGIFVWYICSCITSSNFDIVSFWYMHYVKYVTCDRCTTVKNSVCLVPPRCTPVYWGVSVVYI